VNRNDEQDDLRKKLHETHLQKMFKEVHTHKQIQQGLQDLHTQQLTENKKKKKEKRMVVRCYES
jgi:hypothetical protein